MHVKYLIFALLVIPAVYVHLRGRVRLRPWRQMTDHSTFMAPLNVVMYACSRVQAKPYAPLEAFPELAPLRERWRDIREEAIALREAQRIRASDRYDDRLGCLYHGLSGSGCRDGVGTGTRNCPESHGCTGFFRSTRAFDGGLSIVARFAGLAAASGQLIIGR